MTNPIEPGPNEPDPIEPDPIKSGAAGRISRRMALRLGAGAVMLPALRLPAPGEETAGPRHGLSVFGDLKYAADFSAFDYVRTDAPKGGRLALTASNWAFNQNALTFNTMNGFVLKGDAPPHIELLFDSLMTRALDEPDAVYGLLAESVSVEGDVFRFRLRDAARFHDGSPVTAEDVAFSLMLLKEKGHPSIAQTIRRLVSAEANGPAELVVTLSPERSRDLPLIVAGLPVFSRVFWSTRDFEASTLEPPLGSGPYRVGAFEPGKFVEFARDPDYWGRDLAVNRGQNNFDVIRLEFFRDRDVAFEAFKKGVLDFREEFSSKTWATGYDFPALADGRVARRTFPDDRPSGAQGFFINTRRQKFADPRVREALILAFDFEWSNEKLFFGLYQRTHSFFQNSDMMAKGPPDAAELELLEPYRDRLPADVFGEPFSPPVSDGSGKDRKLLGRAAKLLDEAGLAFAGGRRLQPDGTPFEIEFLEDSKQFERIVLPYVRNLGWLGIGASFRLVDPAQYQLRLKDFDFDITTRRYAMSSTPGESIKLSWGSEAAATAGSDNLSGIADPVIDALIDRVIGADSRATMTIAARALDRVLRAGRYWVPQWYKASHTVAAWDVFGWPEAKPRYGFPVETTWWYDTEKAGRIGRSVK